MLTREQLVAVNEVMTETDTGTVADVALVAPPPALLPAVVDLVEQAQDELEQAGECLDRGDRSAARGHIQRALDHLNESEIED